MVDTGMETKPAANFIDQRRHKIKRNLSLLSAFLTHKMMVPGIAKILVRKVTLAHISDADNPMFSKPTEDAIYRGQIDLGVVFARLTHHILNRHVAVRLLHHLEDEPTLWSQALSGRFQLVDIVVDM